MLKNQLLRISDVSIDFLLEHDPREIESNSLLNINLPRVMINLLNSLSDFFAKESKGTGLRSSRLKDFINRKENSEIFACCIWMVILEYNLKNSGHSSNKPKPRHLADLQVGLEKRIANAYIKLMKKEDKALKRIIEKIYFDIAAHAVFYSLFYAFPKSRIDFDYPFRYFIFSMMSRFFTGLDISPVSKFSQHWNFVDDWYLDLGTGNVLAKKIYNQKFSDHAFKKRLKRGRPGVVEWV